MTRVLLAVPFLLFSAPFAVAHGGGLDASGCHTQRSTGQYHCHRAQAPQPPSNGFSFRNCTEARAAGYSNIRAGTYGYGLHLDRDRDGVGCES
ncbi:MULTISPECIES: excalibur calcium-binding domain-containing protein [unclassified Yoonia]|uniref:excalibur calcium-binding domain-containing protein n=1 Tax=unclassified Yoonia TaxID=2629118 RepID=UPI002AFE8448|nr:MULTISPECIES: excalibur calcium-binding domain-containing protein [unclassified Yoonia]